MIPRVRRLGACAAFASALAVASCAPRVNDLSLHESHDAAADAQDGRRDGVSDGGGADRPEASVGDATPDVSRADAPPCFLGGKTEDDPVTVVCAQATPVRIVIAGDQVYWTVFGTGPVVMKAARAGGEPETIVNDSVPALGLVVDDAFIYYTQPSRGRVMRVPVGGGTPVALATGLDAPTYLARAADPRATSGASLYWTDGNIAGGKIMKLSLDVGAKPVVLVDGQTQPQAIAVSEGFVYWTDIMDGTIMRTSDHLEVVASDAGVDPEADASADAEADASADASADRHTLTAVRLASGLKSPVDLVLVGGFAYVPDRTGRIARVPLAGGALESFVDHIKGTPFGVATDGLSLYWTTLGDGGISKAPLVGAVSPVTPFRVGESNPHYLAVDDIAVFWATAIGGAGAIRKFAK